MQVVIKRLMTDVPFGVLLSGGLDSSLVASLTLTLYVSIGDYLIMGYIVEHLLHWSEGRNTLSLYLSLTCKERGSHSIFYYLLVEALHPSLLVHGINIHMIILEPIESRFNMTESNISFNKNFGPMPQLLTSCLPVMKQPDGEESYLRFIWNII